MRWFLSVLLMIGVLVGSSLVIASAQEGTPPATPVAVTPIHDATPAATPPEVVVLPPAATPVGPEATPVAVTPIHGATPAATPVGDEAAGVLFVQSAPNSTITPLVDAASGATHELALTGGGVDQVAYVGDHPIRTVGAVPTTDVMDLISSESEAENQPTAVLVAQARDGGEEIVVVEIISGVVHVTGDVVYRVSLLTDATGLDLDLESEPVRAITDVQNYETSHLFIVIEDLCHPGHPC